jgi:histidinol-phosphatase (PHP family)
MKALDNLSKYNVEIIDDIKRVDYLAIKAKKALNNLEF